MAVPLRSPGRKKLFFPKFVMKPRRGWREPPPFSDWVDPDSKPNTCRWSNWTGGVFIACWVPTCGNFSVPGQTAQKGRFCICLHGPSVGVPRGTLRLGTFLKIISRTPFLKLNMQKWHNNRHFPKAMLFTPARLLPSACPRRWASNTFQPNIQSIHVEQLPHATEKRGFLTDHPRKLFWMCTL